MDKSQVIFSICFVTVLILLLIGFLLFILFWQRNKSNKFIQEREIMKGIFNEQLLKSQLEIQEQSFNIISMEIHDNVGQTLSLLKVQLNIIDQTEVFDKKLLTDALENVGKVMTDLRDIAKSLSTERIHVSSLSEIIEYELQRISQVGVIRVSYQHEGEEQLLRDEKKLIVFRMVQECFQNIIKHSNAANLAVRFINGDEGLKIEVADDGIGFDTTLLTENGAKGLGLQNMMTRAAMIGGEAQINSIINKGTTVTITTPYV